MNHNDTIEIFLPISKISPFSIGTTISKMLIDCDSIEVF